MSKKGYNSLKTSYKEYNKSISKHAQTKIKLEKTKMELFNTCLFEYSDPTVQQSLLDNARKYNYSTMSIAQLEKNFKEWNQDNININCVDDIMAAEKYVLEMQAKESPFYKFGDFINKYDEGGDV